MSLERKREDAEKERADNIAFQAYWKRRNSELAEKEYKERQEYKTQCQGLQEIWGNQVAQKEKRVEEGFKHDLTLAEKINTTLAEEENTFNSWAERCVKEWEGNVLFVVILTDLFRGRTLVRYSGISRRRRKGLHNSYNQTITPV
jgi:hypothetical protein